MGTLVGAIRSIDKDGYCMCDLHFVDTGIDTREIHISDLRVDNDEDKDRLEMWADISRKMELSIDNETTD